MVTKAQFSTPVTNSDYIKHQLLLKAFEVQLKREKSIEPDEALFVTCKNAKWKLHNGDSSNGRSTVRSGNSTTQSSLRATIRNAARKVTGKRTTGLKEQIERGKAKTHTLEKLTVRG